MTFKVKFAAGCTFTVTVSDEFGPLGKQSREYVRLDVRLPEDWEPDVPVQPVGLTVHDVALVEVQEIVEAVL
jgi:hypothetical protein